MATRLRGLNEHLAGSVATNLGRYQWHLWHYKELFSAACFRTSHLWSFFVSSVHTHWWHVYVYMHIIPEWMHGQWLVWLQVHFFNVFVSMPVGRSASSTRHLLSQRLFVTIFNFRVSHLERITIMKGQCITVIIVLISSTLSSWVFLFVKNAVCSLPGKKGKHSRYVCREVCQV